MHRLRSYLHNVVYVVRSRSRRCCYVHVASCLCKGHNMGFKCCCALIQLVWWELVCLSDAAGVVASVMLLFHFLAA